MSFNYDQYFNNDLHDVSNSEQFLQDQSDNSQEQKVLFFKKTLLIKWKRRCIYKTMKLIYFHRIIHETLQIPNLSYGEEQIYKTKIKIIKHGEYRINNTDLMCLDKAA